MNVMLTWLYRSVFVLGLVTLLAGCGGSENVVEPTPLQPLEHAEVHPDIVWTANGGDGAFDDNGGLQLAISGETVYVANQGGDVAAFDIEDGNRLWHENTGHTLVSGPTVAGDDLLIGTRNGRLLAISAQDGSDVWDTNVDSEIMAPPATRNDIAVVRTLDGRMTAYDVGSGNRLWTAQRSVPDLTMRGTSAPVIVGSRVYAGLDNGHVLALDLDTGKQYWDQTVAEPTGRTELERLVDIDADLLVADGTLYAISVGNKLASLSMSSGRIRWKQDVASATGLTFDQNDVFTTDLDSVVHAVSRLSGARDWTQDALKYRRLGAPVMMNGYVVVGDYEGYLHWLDAQSGEIVGRIHALDAPIRATPVVIGDLLLVVDVNGNLAAVRLDSGD